LTSLGVIESVRVTSDIEDVRRWTAKRSVFSDAELTDWMKEKKSIKIIDFLLVGHIDPPILLAQAIQKKALTAHPQSIVQLPEKDYRRLKLLLPAR
jgi:hypothetical protein